MLSHPEGHHSTKGEETGETATSPADGDKINDRGKEVRKPRLNYTDIVEDYRANDGRLAADSQKMYEGLQEEDAEIEVARQEDEHQDQAEAATKLKNDLDELKDMFSNFDSELIQDLYLGLNLDKQATVEALLKLSRDGGGSDRESIDESSGPSMTPQEYEEKYPALAKKEGDWEFVPRGSASSARVSDGEAPSYKEITVRHHSSDTKDADDFVHVK
ncbi:hypothetical protein Pmar_PMAR004469 [Perkinsus marinus ATCC 50983]|uniref:CUE domain-containing protein n=1 Tax=Perkinsus marinus (strain ATCC 50983 / TXsc) TaxID=423536 RepID=C5LZR3_PERM5|nr:hypothetical protein Pmar_PMAR004469 [Perkinsus marinus ATCC 50983]EEQ97731.1 hypothetical protein Pmar_PMAR004469 [Perkinsus marinus ATCC 50983]|eukprot:XP_002765014.1 hypothetical protein Pmar_PMAR004469 [Perkinsus marinus ATCC 50983]